LGFGICVARYYVLIGLGLAVRGRVIYYVCCSVVVFCSIDCCYCNVIGYCCLWVLVFVILYYFVDFIIGVIIISEGGGGCSWCYKCY